MRAANPETPTHTLTRANSYLSLGPYADEQPAGSFIHTASMRLPPSQTTQRW
jgi:hypothetical protein